MKKLPRSSVRDVDKTVTAPRETERIYELPEEQLSPRSLVVTESNIDVDQSR